MEQYLTLKLKSFGCYATTAKGAFIYTEHGFRVFIPKDIIKKLLLEEQR